MYNIGSKVRLSVTFTVGVNPTDPTTVRFKLQKPDNTVVPYVYGVDAALCKSSTGIYYVDLTIAAGGCYLYRFEGVGVCDAAAEGSLLVDSSTFYGG